MMSFAVTNKKPNGFFMLLTLVHVSSGISLNIREKYVAGKINVTRQKLNEIEDSSVDLSDIGDWSALEDLDELIERDILGLDQLPQNEWVDYFLPQLDDLEDNAVANFELVDWFRQFTKIKNVKYSKDDVSIKWFEDGNLNVSYNLSLIHI